MSTSSSIHFKMHIHHNWDIEIHENNTLINSNKRELNHQSQYTLITSC